MGDVLTSPKDMYKGQLREETANQATTRSRSQSSTPPEMQRWGRETPPQRQVTSPSRYRYQSRQGECGGLVTVPSSSHSATLLTFGSGTMRQQEVLWSKSTPGESQYARHSPTGESCFTPLLTSTPSRGQARVSSSPSPCSHGRRWRGTEGEAELDAEVLRIVRYLRHSEPTPSSVNYHYLPEQHRYTSLLPRSTHYGHHQLLPAPEHWLLHQRHAQAHQRILEPNRVELPSSQQSFGVNIPLLVELTGHMMPNTEAPLTQEYLRGIQAGTFAMAAMAKATNHQQMMGTGIQHPTPEALPSPSSSTAAREIDLLASWQSTSYLERCADSNNSDPSSSSTCPGLDTADIYSCGEQPPAEEISTPQETNETHQPARVISRPPPGIVDSPAKVALSFAGLTLGSANACNAGSAKISKPPADGDINVVERDEYRFSLMSLNDHHGTLIAGILVVLVMFLVMRYRHQIQSFCLPPIRPTAPADEPRLGITFPPNRVYFPPSNESHLQQHVNQPANQHHLDKPKATGIYPGTIIEKDLVLVRQGNQSEGLTSVPPYP